VPNSHGRRVWSLGWTSLKVMVNFWQSACGLCLENIFALVFLCFSSSGNPVPDMTYNVFSGTLNPTQSVSLQVISWEPGIWFPAFNNSCHSFLSSAVLLSATYFAFIKSLSRCILFLPHVASPSFFPWFYHAVMTHVLPHALSTHFCIFSLCLT